MKSLGCVDMTHKFGTSGGRQEERRQRADLGSPGKWPLNRLVCAVMESRHFSRDRDIC